MGVQQATFRIMNQMENGLSIILQFSAICPGFLQIMPRKLYLVEDFVTITNNKLFEVRLSSL